MAVPDAWEFAAEAIIDSELGEEITWRPDTASEATIRAVFGRGFEKVSSGEIRVASRSPEINVALADLDEDPAKDYEVDIRGALYTISSIRHDVEGVSVYLVLKKV